MANKRSLTLLLLGASKRVSLAERFLNSARAMGIELEIFSCEKDAGFYPISQYAHILAGPKFTDEAQLQQWLEKTATEKEIDIILPHMDSATVALSRFAERRTAPRPWAVVSSPELCEAMEDKIKADRFFREHGIPTPDNKTGRYPKIAKPAQGFGSKGIVKLNNEQEEQRFRSINNSQDYLIQDFIEGAETTVDFYISKAGKLIGYVLRDRIEVSDGEVMVCRTRPPSSQEREVIEKVAAIPGWVGCITLQYLRTPEGKVYVLEVNPRFGGGATAGIEAGLDMPSYVLADYLGQTYGAPKKLKNLIMTRARRDFFQEVVS